MTGQNDRPDESLTGQPHDQAGHCPLTGRYFEPLSNCRQQRGARNPKPRLLLRMRRMYVVSIRLDFH